MLFKILRSGGSKIPHIFPDHILSTFLESAPKTALKKLQNHTKSREKSKTWVP